MSKHEQAFMNDFLWFCPKACENQGEELHSFSVTLHFCHMRSPPPPHYAQHAKNIIKNNTLRGNHLM